MLRTASTLSYSRRVRTVGCLLSLACMLLSISIAHANGVERPNVLILYADDLGFGDLAIQNSESKIPTPNLDQLAKQGMRFTDGHSSSGICTPSRYALLTGRYHWRDFHDIVGVFGGSVFQPQQLTLPEMMQSSGYTTAAIGKWHLGWDWEAIMNPTARSADKDSKRIFSPDDFDWSKPIPDGPLAHGFDSYFGDTVINFPPYCWIENDRVAQAPDTMMDTDKWKSIKEGNWECRPGPMVSGWDPYQNIPTTTRRGVDFIKAQGNSDKPFFLYFAFPSPHAPIIPNDEFDGKSQAGAYGDFVFETDDAIGQLLAALDESDQAENTIVIFSADNGSEHYAYARDQNFDHWSSNPFRGVKRDIYEGGHHVPLIVRWPGITATGSVSDALVSQVDIMATLATMLHFDLPDSAASDSFDLTPILTGEKEPVRTAIVHNTYAKSYAIRDGDWLLVDAKDGYVSRRDKAWEARHGYKPDDALPVELYNLAEDIRQRHNIAQEHPERVAKMQSLMRNIQDQGFSAPRLSQR